MTLRPGDVISTGTPGGVGIFRDPVEVLEPGRTTEAEIEGIGTLTNTVVEQPLEPRSLPRTGSVNTGTQPNSPYEPCLAARGGIPVSPASREIHSLG